MLNDLAAYPMNNPIRSYPYQKTIFRSKDRIIKKKREKLSDKFILYFSHQTLMIFL